MASAVAEQTDDLRALYGNANDVLPESREGEGGVTGALLPPGPSSHQEPTRVGWCFWVKGTAMKMKQEVLALNYATQDKRLGILPRALALFAIAYALSPLDLIPDFIPVLGLIDDILILGVLLFLAIYLVPQDVMAAARERAEREPLRLHKNWGMALAFFAAWDALLLALVWFACTFAGRLHPGIGPYKVWIMVGTGLVVVAAELAWAAAQWSKERRMQAVLTAAGTQADLQEVLLQGGTQAVQEYLEP